MAVATPPPAVSPTPFSDALRQQLDAAMGRVPADKKGQATVGASLTGLEASLGWKLSEQWDASAWYGRQWRGGAQEAGVRLRFAF